MSIVVFAMAGVAPTKPRWNQIFNGLAEEFSLCVSKQFRGARVGTTNYPLGIRDKDRVRRDLEKILQRGLSKLGPFTPRRSRCGLFRGIRRTHLWLQPVLDTTLFYPADATADHFLR